MTLKLNTFTGTWINEKLMKQKQDAESRRILETKESLIVEAYESQPYPVATEIEGIINHDNDFGRMAEEIDKTCPQFIDIFFNILDFRKK